MDTTGSTPLPIDAKARPLAIDPRFEGDLAAQAWLWKDHSAAEEAAAITAIARQHAPQYLAPIGGTYSSEWWWSKIWKCLKVAPEVFDAAASWVELADFIPAVLAGVTDSRDIVRCICAAGHKAMYSEEWGGLPSKEFLARLDPRLAELRDRLYDRALPPGFPPATCAASGRTRSDCAKASSSRWADSTRTMARWGPGSKTGTLVKIIGTSTCDCAISRAGEPGGSPPANGSGVTIPGICGIVNGSILPGFLGIEAGQSAVGDILNWWVEVVCATEGTESADTIAARHERLSREAALSKPGASGLLALDWNNGNRTILVDPKLTGLLLGQTLHTTRAEIYRALIEATAFGARTIIERIKEYGVPIDRVVCCGGIAGKNELFLQIYADVIGQPMLVAGSSQAPALGAAISAAVTAGEHPSWTAAQRAMTSRQDRQFTPNPAAHAVYNELYAIYRALHDEFGNVTNVNLGDVMKRLLAIRNHESA